ncbi:MAG: hypothetical protein BGO34_10200 [Bacteroidia bacterium 44-10]|nr:MAG: hypothetical protein BGO34_10200 [Bacteroidia bacterium 44-10]
MVDYDFRILQYNEFENLTRDLLQAEFGIYIESFKDGKDGGIDLRYGTVKGGNTIVQVKRYKDWKELKPQLEKEVKKVKRLNPKKYILSTSAGLSPANKSTIMAMFSPYIVDSKDIYGHDDLNNLIGKHKDIEEKYYKLWLASTTVLQEIVNKDVRNWSSFELDSIKEQITTYVNNDSFTKAFGILKEHRYVIISGIPGIGKTTLARMLAYNALANGFEELVCIQDNLNDGVKLFQKGKKQVFFFDDFLGSNVFEPGEKDFDRKLISFIDAIKREKDKIFILTTREYILSEAKIRYERFQTNNIEIAKCTVDLGVYTRYIRANILYNHLAEANLPDEYIEQILHDKEYKKLIDHPHFNPRIIETYIDRQLWQKFPAKEFMLRFEEFFYKPTMVWQLAFENLDIKARYSLLVLASMGEEIYIENWYDAFQYFCQSTHSSLGLTCDEQEWKKILKILQDCFIKINKREDHTLVHHFNPSILGFVVAYLNESRETQKLLLQNAYYVEQLCTIFRDSPRSFFGGDAYVCISENLFQYVVRRFEEMMSETPKSCEVSRYGGQFYGQRGYNEVLFFAKFMDSYPILLHRYEGLVERTIYPDEFTYQTTPFSARADLLPKLDWEKISTDLNPIIESMTWEDLEISEYRDLLTMFDAIGMSERKEEKSLLKKIEEKIYYEIDKQISNVTEAEDLSGLVDEIMDLVPYELFKGDFLSDLEDKKKSFEELEEDYDEDAYREFRFGSIKEDDAAIEEMMTSLREL